MEGATDSGCIQINGAAAHRAEIGDLIIIAAYAAMSRQEAATWQPKIVLVDAAQPSGSGAAAAGLVGDRRMLSRPRTFR